MTHLLLSAMSIVLMLAWPAVGQSSLNREFITVPHGCFEKQQEDCLLQLSSIKKKQVKLASSVISLAKKSILYFKTQKEVHLVEGKYLLEDKKSLNFKALSAIFKLDGKMLVTSKTKDIHFTVIEGSVAVELLGYDRSFIMYPGYKYVLDSVNVNGEMSFEFPSPANYKNTIRLWAKLYFGKKSDFSLQARQFAEVVKNSARSSAKVYQQIVERRVATHKQSLKNKANRKKSIEAENSQLRALFRKKNYLQ